MQVLIEIPEKTVTLASAILAQQCASNKHDEQLLDTAVENCKKAPVAVNVEQALAMEATEFLLGAAILGINTELQKLK